MTYATSWLTTVYFLQGVSVALKVFSIQSDKDNWHIVAGTVAVIASAALTPILNIPRFIMQSNSPIFLCFYLRDSVTSDDDGIWHPSVYYLALLGLDCVLFYAIITFLTFLGKVALNLASGVPLILETLR